MNELQPPTSKFALLLSAGLFIAIYCCLSWYFSSTIGRIVLEGKFPVGGVVTIEFENFFGGVVKEKIEFAKIPLRDKQRVSTHRVNAPVKHVRMEFWLDDGKTPAARAVVNLYDVHIDQPFAGSSVISKANLPLFFSSDSFFGGRDAFIQLTKKSDQTSLSATLESRQSLPQAAWYWAAFPAFFVTFLFFLVVRNHRWKDIPAIRDMGLGRHISSTSEFDMINGIRGLAALLVLFSHAAPGFEAVNMGIAILFVISGFLLSKPFVIDSDAIFNGRTIERYLVKRIKRILPMYYSFIFITYVLTLDFNTALRNFLFVEASGHLWPMTQIFTFYMLLPVVLLLTSLLFRIHKALPIVILCAASFLWLEYFSNWQPYYNGRYFKEFYLYAFLLGVAGAYLHFSTPQTTWFDRLPSSIAGLVLVLLLTAVAWSAPLDPPSIIKPIIVSFYGKCVISLLLIIALLRLSKTWIRWVIANPLFRSVGVIGFSFYLLHGLGMQLANHFLTAIAGIEPSDTRSWTLTLFAFAITYLMSLLTYSYIERPFFGYRERRS